MNNDGQESTNSPFIRDGQAESRFDRECNITRKEFMRQLPEAIGNRKFEVDGNRILVKDGDKRVLITVRDEGAEKMGALDVTMKQVSFSFEGYSEPEIEAFMKNYDEKTLRVGGM